jgi:cytochrome c peroxidase
MANDNPLLILQHRKIKEKFVLTAPIFDATGNRTAGGVGCAACHAAPEFDIDPNTRNNGIIGVLNGTGIDIPIQEHPLYEILLKPMVPLMAFYAYW